MEIRNDECERSFNWLYRPLRTLPPRCLPFTLAGDTIYMLKN